MIPDENDINITEETLYDMNDDEYLPLTKCKCGQIYESWHFVLSIYRDDPRECRNCKRKLYFRNRIVVYEKRD